MSTIVKRWTLSCPSILNSRPISSRHCVKPLLAYAGQLCASRADLAPAVGMTGGGAALRAARSATPLSSQRATSGCVTAPSPS